MRFLRRRDMENREAIRCVLFDFDGVVADTERSNIGYLERALAVFGLGLNEEQRRALIGVNTLDVIRPLLAAAEPPVSEEELAWVRKQQGNTYEDSPQLCTLPGFRELLSRLRLRGVKTGLVSSTSSRLILAALNRLSLTGQFDLILCGDMVERKKPDPECYRRAMTLLDIPPEACAVVEDSPVGISAGRASGAYVVGYEGGQIRQDTGLAHARIAHFSECAELPPFRELLKDTENEEERA